MKNLNKVPVNHRILLHLKSYQQYIDRYEVPFALAQMGIAEHVEIHRAAAARGLNELVENGLIVSMTKHVVKGKRKRKVYFLTADGREEVSSIEKTVLKSTIEVIRRGECDGHLMSLEEAIHDFRNELSFIRILNNIQNGVLDANRLIEGKNGSKGIWEKEKDGSLNGKAFTSHKEGIGEISSESLEDHRHYFSPGIPDVSGFTGRKEEMDAILKTIDDPKTFFVIIQGLAGIGKTSLAARIAHELRNMMDIQWIEIHKWTGFNSFVKKILDGKVGGRERSGMIGKIRADDMEFEELLEMTVEYLSDSRSLIILDDLQFANKSILDFLEALTRTGRKNGGITFLVTSRTKPDFYDLRLSTVEGSIMEFSLGGLSYEDAYELVNRQGRRNRGSTDPGVGLAMEMVDGVTTSIMPEERFRDFYHETKGHPFALELISGWNTRSVKMDFQRFLNEEIFDSLSGEEEIILKYAGVFRFPFELDLFLETIPNTTISRGHVDRLLIHNILKEKDGNIHLHSIISDFIKSRLSTSEKQLFNGSAADYYSRMLNRMEQMTDPGSVGERMLTEDRSAVRSSFENKGMIEQQDKDSIKDNGFQGYFEVDTGEISSGMNDHVFIIQRIHHLLMGGEPEKAVQEMMVHADELISLGYSEFYEVLEMVNKEDIPDGSEDDFAGILVDAHREFGRIDQAIARYRDKLVEIKDDSIEKASLFQKIGDLEMEKGNITSSIEFRKKSLNIFQKKRDHRKTARVYNDLGLDLMKTDRIDEARIMFGKAIEFLNKSGDNEHISRLHLNLAYLESEAGQMKTAEVHLKKSLQEAQTPEEHIGVYHLYGDLSVSAGKYEMSCEYFEKGLELAMESRDLPEILYLVDRLSAIYIDEGMNARAIQILSKGIQFMEKQSAKEKKGFVDFINFQYFKKVSRTIMDSRKIQSSGNSGDVEGPGVSNDIRSPGTGNMGTRSGLTRRQEDLRENNYRFAGLCERANGLLDNELRHDEALSFLGRAGSIYRSFHDQERLVRILMLIGKNRTDAGDLVEAARMYRESVIIFQKLSDTKGCAIAYLNLAGVVERILKDATDPNVGRDDGIRGVDGERVGSANAGKWEKLLLLYEKAGEYSDNAGFTRGREIADVKIRDLKERGWDG